MPPKKQANERLLIEAAQKDPSRFAEVYEENFARVYAYVARRVRDRDAAQDLTSEVFHQALAEVGRFEWRGAPFAAWLYRIAANAIADRWNQKARERGNPLPNDPPDERADANPEETERRAELFRLVTKLPRDQRSVIEMRFAEGKNIREIARELRRSEGAVKQLQFRGLESLRERLSGARGKKLGGRNG